MYPFALFGFFAASLMLPGKSSIENAEQSKIVEPNTKRPYPSVAPQEKLSEQRHFPISLLFAGEV